MAAPADIRVRVTGLALLRVGFCRQTMAIANPRQRVIFGFARMTLYTRGIFVTHATSLRVRTVGEPMLLLVISGMVCGVRCCLMAHDTVFWRVFAVVTDKTVFHLRMAHVAIEVFPFGNARVTTAALKFFVLFMGKNKLFSEAFAGAGCLAGLLEMTKTTVALLTGLEMTFKAALFAGAPESIVDFNLMRKNTADIRSDNIGRPQRLPAGRHCRHRRFTVFTVNMADSAVHRILFVGFMRKAKVGLGLVAARPDKAGERKAPQNN